MEFCAGDAEVFEFLVADCDSGFVLSLIQRRANGEPVLVVVFAIRFTMTS